MKKSTNHQSMWGVMALLMLLLFGYDARSQTQVTTSMTNCVSTANTIEYDLYVQNTGTTDVKYRSHTIRFQMSLAIRPAGATVTNQYIAGTGSPALAALQASYPTIAPTIGASTITVNNTSGATVYDATTSPLLPVGQSFHLGRFRMTCSQNWNPNSNPATFWNTSGQAMTLYVPPSTSTFAPVIGTSWIQAAPCALIANPPLCTTPTLTATTTPQSCSNVNDGAIDLTISNGGASPYSVVWSNGSATQDLTGLAPGTYTVTATADQGGCTATNSFTVAAGPAAVEYFADVDHDNFGGASLGLFCSAPLNSATVGGDCNDNNAAINPSAQEVCDGGVDNDCDGVADDNDPSTAAAGKLTFYQDLDADTYGSSVSVLACVAPAQHVSVSGDCNDTNSSINPGAQEVCDANDIDEDCDGVADDQDLSTLASSKSTFYQDLDGDSYGSSVSVLACSAPAQHVSVSGDCNDNNSAISPAAQEVCDGGVDNDCDGVADDNDPSTSAASKSTFYVDADGDTYGGTTTVLACVAQPGTVSVSGDCNDASASIHPNAVETCNNIDDDCDLSIDEDVVFSNYYRDQDNDTYGDATASPVSACSPPAGFVLNNLDCNDNSASVFPGATEICNNADDDCDGSIDEGVKNTYYVDADNDSYGGTLTLQACTLPPGHSMVSGDCDDNNSAINPAASEICDGGVDNDCDGAADDLDASLTGAPSWYADNDGDTYGAGTATVACIAPAGFVSSNTDCNDASSSINPAATEVCNDLDDDCDGTADDGIPTNRYYADADGDTYGSQIVFVDDCDATAPAGYVTNNLDCNDNMIAVNPDATESCGDLIDNDCDGQTDEGCNCDNPALANAGGNQTVCAGDPVSLTGQFGNTPGALWTTSGDGSFACPTCAITTYTQGPNDQLAGTVDLTLTASDPDGAGPCTDESSTITITITALPAAAAPISGPATLCYPQSPVTFFTAPVAGATSYQWTVPAGTTIVSGQGTTALTVSWPFSSIHAGVQGYITVTPQNANSCGSATGSQHHISVQLTTPVTPGSISGAGKACAGDLVTYSVATVARADYYQWTLPPFASFVGASNGNIIQVQYSAGFSGGTLSCAAVNGCGTGASRSRSVGVNILTAPTAINGQNSGLCGATSVPFSAVAVTGATSYFWTLPAGASFVGSPSGQSILVDFSGAFGTGSISVAAVNGCGIGTARSMTLRGAPGTPNPVSGPTTVCPGQTYTYDVASVPGAATYLWTVPSGASITGGAGSKTVQVTYGSFLATGQQITVRAQNGCGISSTRVLSGISIVACPRIGETGASMALNAFPNPASEILNITFSSDKVANANLRLVDLTGRVVYNEAKEVNEGFNTGIVRVKGLASGIYTLQLQMEDRTEQIRIFVE